MAGILTSSTVIFKQPSEVLNLSMDFSAWLLTTSIILSSPTISIELLGGGTSDVVIDSSGISGQTVTMTLSGGTAGRHRVEVGVTASDGQTLEGDGILKVSDK